MTQIRLRFTNIFKNVLKCKKWSRVKTFFNIEKYFNFCTNIVKIITYFASKVQRLFKVMKNDEKYSTTETDCHKIEEKLVLADPFALSN